MSSLEYQPVESSRLYETVAAQIQRKIFEGDLNLGTKLPPESALAEEFGVSRTVIREAIQSLKSRGFVSVKQGAGVFVTEPTKDTLTEVFSVICRFRGVTLGDLHQIREVLEVEIAGLAAQAGSEEDRLRLLACLEAMERNRESAHDHVELDLMFHGLLAKATGNEVFLLLLEALILQLRRSRITAISVPRGLERSLAGHRAIYESIARRDSEGARTAMRQHLADVRDRLVQVGEFQLGCGPLEKEVMR